MPDQLKDTSTCPYFLISLDWYLSTPRQVRKQINRLLRRHDPRGSPANVRRYVAVKTAQEILLDSTYVHPMDCYCIRDPTARAEDLVKAEPQWLSILNKGCEGHAGNVSGGNDDKVYSGWSDAGPSVMVTKKRKRDEEEEEIVPESLKWPYRAPTIAYDFTTPPQPTNDYGRTEDEDDDLLVISSRVLSTGKPQMAQTYLSELDFTARTNMVEWDDRRPANTCNTSEPPQHPNIHEGAEVENNDCWIVSSRIVLS